MFYLLFRTRIFISSFFSKLESDGDLASDDDFYNIFHSHVRLCAKCNLERCRSNYVHLIPKGSVSSRTSCRLVTTVSLAPLYFTSRSAHAAKTYFAFNWTWESYRARNESLSHILSNAERFQQNSATRELDAENLRLMITRRTISRSKIISEVQENVRYVKWRILYQKNECEWTDGTHCQSE